MEVILLDNIGKLGGLGDKVTVKPGYGRNYLVPYGLAVPATKDNIEAFEAQRAELEAQAAERKAEAEARAEQLNDIELSLVSKAGDEGKLFGSIGPRDLADAISSAGIDIAKSEVRMPNGPIRQTGEYDITLHLHAEAASKGAGFLPRLLFFRVSASSGYSLFFGRCQNYPAHLPLGILRQRLDHVGSRTACG